MAWQFFQKQAPPKIAYLALSLAIIAFFTPGIYFAAMDELLPQRTVALKGFLSGIVLAVISFGLSVVGRYQYRKKDDKEGAKHAKIVIIVSGLILVFHVCVFTIFLTT